MRGGLASSKSGEARRAVVAALSHASRMCRKQACESGERASTHGVGWTSGNGALELGIRLGAKMGFSNRGVALLGECYRKRAGTRQLGVAQELQLGRRLPPAAAASRRWQPPSLPPAANAFRSPRVCFSWRRRRHAADEEELGCFCRSEAMRRPPLLLFAHRLLP